MIVAGLTLIGIGASDLVRRFVIRKSVRTVLLILLLLVMVGIGVCSDAIIAAVIAGVLAGMWLWSMPLDARGSVSFWPAVALGGVIFASTAFLSARPRPGLIGGVWSLHSPIGDIDFDVAVLAVGVMLFATESANAVVRAALDREGVWRPADLGGTLRGGRLRQAQPPATGFQGGRLIGPLERIIMIVLTLTSAYPLLAAMLAAKGIVRFPEISKDGETGARAEYFLVGSLVSWAIALAGAFLMWWGAPVAQS